MRSRRNDPDLTRPNVNLTTPSNHVTGAFTVTIVFDEEVTGFDETDIRITNGRISGFSEVTGNTRVYTLQIDPITSGIVTIEVPQGRRRITPETRCSADS